MNPNLKDLYIYLIGMNAKPVKMRRLEDGVAIYLDRVVSNRSPTFKLTLANGETINFPHNPTCLELKNNEE